MDFRRPIRALFGKTRPIGVVDTRGSRIAGWAYDAAAGRPVTLEFLVDGMNAGTAVADRYRADLRSESPDGRCAFEFVLPPRWLDGSTRTVEVRVQGGRGRLLGDRFTETLHPPDHLFAILRRVLRGGAWSTAASVSGDTMTLDGWCIAPPGIERGVITANGCPVDIPMTDGYPGWKSPLPPGTTARTFAGRVPIDRTRDEIHLSFGVEEPFSPLQDLYVPLFDVAIPDAERRKRVDGHGIDAAFNLGGYSNAKKLDAIAQRYAGRPLAGLGPVLDWGCGCGRVARFVARIGAELFGADIDADNALWCREHINANFAAISPDPPTPYASDTFGAIYGLSVFTHLTKEYEKAWLAELHRIARPGALILMSVHGGLMAASSGMLEHIASSQFAEGFADIGRNPDIDAVTRGSAYYRNVFHQPDYIAKVWGQYFEILAIEEGVIDNLHDLVVARKPL